MLQDIHQVLKKKFKNRPSQENLYKALNTSAHNREGAAKIWRPVYQYRTAAEGKQKLF